MKILGWILFVRLLMGLISQTWYVPDETWQSVEVSHDVVYGVGYRTWEWDEKIRSSLHPLLFSLPLLLLKLTGLDSQFMVVLLPKLTQGGITGLCEYCLYRVIDKNERVGSWFLLITLFNWHTLYSGSRTLINSLEYSLTSLALALYITLTRQDSKPRRFKYPGELYLPVIALCVMLRPTSALIWIPLVILHLISSLKYRVLLSLVPWVLLSVLVVILCVSIDSIFYSQPTLVNLNFFYINVYKNLGKIYGTHPWHWYFSSALPSLLGPLLLLLVPGLRHAPLHLLLPLGVNLLCLSLLPHKEIRFLQSSLPFLVIIISDQLCGLSRAWQRMIKIVFLFMNILLTLYLSTVHQRGVVDAVLSIPHYSTEIGKREMSVLFLMPCHSTPLYSHIHANISTRFLHCEPDLTGSPGYMDEADRFYSDPELWLEQVNLNPDLVILFNNLQGQISEFLKSYKLCQTFFHSHLPDGRIGEHVLVFCKQSSV